MLQGPLLLPIYVTDISHITGYGISLLEGGIKTLHTFFPLIPTWTKTTKMICCPLINTAQRCRLNSRRIKAAYSSAQSKPLQ